MGGFAFRSGPPLGIAVSVALLALTTTAHAQITLDGSLGPGGALAGPNYNITSNLGQIRGNNLFHSFGRFNVGTGESASFSGPSSISNIIGRVTGGQRSTIDGLLQSTISGANLFLINPRGVVFGPNASLDVSGSFHVSTADYIRFADGARFHADLGQQSVLTAAPPTAFGFLGPTAAPISVEGSFLQVPDGQALSIVAGNVTITGGALTAPGGRVQIASVASAGEVVPSALDQPPALAMLGFGALGRIDITGGATIDTSSATGGTVVIRGGQLFVDGAAISSHTFGDVDGARTGIDILLTESLSLANFASLSTIAFGAGRAGDVLLSAPSVLLDTGASVNTFAFAAGRGGDVQLAGTDVRLDNGANAFTLTFGDGASGDIGVNTGTLTLNGGAIIAVITGGTGPGGSLTVNATDGVTIAGRDPFGNASALSTQAQAFTTGAPGTLTVTTPTLTLDAGGSINTQALGSARGGDVVLTLGQLRIAGGAQIFSNAGDTGDGGNILVTATGTVTISGVGDDGTPSGIVSSSQGAVPGAGRPGDIGISAAGVTLAEGGIIRAGDPTLNLEAGNVSVNATDSILISADSGISSQALLQDAGVILVTTPALTIDGGFIRATTIGPGRGGEIALGVGTLTLLRGGQVATSSELAATGNGGNVLVVASRGVTIDGTAGVGGASGVFSTTAGVGDAGAIAITAPTLSVSSGARVSVATSGAGRAGDIDVNAGTVAVSSSARVDSGTTGAGPGGNVRVAGTNVMLTSGGGLFSEATATGRGGDIAVQGTTVTLTEGGTLSARSTGTGDAGNIAVTAFDSLTGTHGIVTTQAVVADGGNIQFTVGNLLHLVDSQVTTSVESGFGSGGNITIDPRFVILDGSTIRADAFGGPGGNVLIVADVFLTTGSIVSASSALGVPGIIDIQATVTDLSGSVVDLPESLLSAASLLRASCATRLAVGGMASSLVVAGRDGVPAEPGGQLPSPIVFAAPVDAAPSPAMVQPPPLQVVFDPRCVK